MPYSYDEETIREVRERTDIVEIISRYVDLKKAGANYKGLCPFHSEKTPSLVVSTEKQLFNCFGCGEGGDVISFLVKYKNTDFVEVVRELADEANIELKQKTEKDIESERKLNLLYEINREAAIIFYRNLTKSKKSLEYLQSRGISVKTMKRFGLGFALDSWDTLLNHLLKKGYSESEIERAGLAVKHREKNSYYDRFRNRIIFPIWNIHSKIIGFGGRLLENSSNQPKYLNSPETLVFSKGKNLYGLNLVKDRIRGKRLVLVEGYMDVISLHQNGVSNSVASLGTALTREQVKLIKRYTEDIVIVYDSDEAGIKAATKAVEIIVKENVTPKVVVLDKGLDPDEYIKRFGTDMFEFKVKNADHYIDFLIKINKQKFDLNLIEDKLKFIKEMSSWLLMIESPVEYELYVNKIAVETGVKAEVIKSEIKRNKNYYKQKKDSIPKSKAAIPEVEKKHDVNRHLEMELLCLVIDKSLKIDELQVDIALEDFQDGINRKIAVQMNDCTKVSMEKLLEIETDESIKVRLLEIKSMKLNLIEEQKEKALIDYAKKIKKESLKKRKKEIVVKLAQLENIERQEVKLEFVSLCRELTEIEKDIKRF